MDSMTEQGCPLMESTFSLKVKKWAKRKRGERLTKAVAQNNLKCRFCFHMLQLLCVKEFERESQSYVVASENAWESKAFWLHRLITFVHVTWGIGWVIFFFCYGSIRIISQMWQMLCILLTFSREWNAHEWANYCPVIKWIVL